MKLLSNTPAILTLVLLLAACTRNAPPNQPPEALIAKVNGQPITVDEFDTYVTLVARRPAKELTSEQRNQVLDSLIAMHLVAAAAEQAGLAQQPEIARQLTLSRINLLSEAAFKQELERHPITDVELKAEYDLQIAGSGREYRARHILVESRAAADELITQLNKGADFAKLAAQNSIDGSAKQGGDLGWFALKTMVPQFANAVASLEKGKYTTVPVQTQFGWHVIKLEDTRASAPPPFEEVKAQVKELVQRKKLQAYVETLKKTAKIDKLNTDKPEPIKPAPTPSAK